MSVSVLVPYGPGCAWRARAWDYVRARYERLHPDWQLIEGHAPASTWSKGAAIDDAFERSTSDAIVIADADSFVDDEILTNAVEQLERHNWIVPHLVVRRLNRTATKSVLAGGEPRRNHLDRAAYAGLPGGGIVVLRRSAYETVGGIDRRFLGWGGEDISFAWALETLVEPAQRLLADLWHLWHPPATVKRRGSPASELLASRYREARHDPDAMRLLIAERTAGEHPDPVAHTGDASASRVDH